VRQPAVALVTYSTRPRGGAVHTLHLAEALQRLGEQVQVVALGEEDAGLFRPTTVPYTIVPAAAPGPTLEERVFGAVDALAEGLAQLAPGFDVLHTQDCISARAAARVRDAGAPLVVVRTVHHVDDFTTPALVDCQRRAILEPDHVLVVSDHWRRILLDDYGVVAEVVGNGVEPARFAAGPAADRDARRAGIGTGGRFLFLTVGGIEPRKGSAELVAALGALARTGPAAQLAVVGGHSFQDYAAYRERVLDRAGALGLELGRDLVLLGTVPEAELVAWYHAADAFVFPSRNEGWGLVVLEAMAAGLPVVASDIPAIRGYLTPDRDALLVPAGDAAALAGAMRRLASDAGLRAGLAAAGPAVARRFPWEAVARRHQAVYARLAVSAARRRGPRWSGAAAPSAG
jgi:glycosyltransferase-like protein